MSIFQKVKDSAGTGVTVLGFVGVIGSVTAYGTNLKNQFDASQTKIVQLETQVATLREQLEKAYNAPSGQGMRGPKGDKGDPGETGAQGPRGERGDKGDPGPAANINPASINEIIARIDALEKKSTMSTTQASLTNNSNITSKPGSCWVKPEELRSGSVTLTDGTRLCEKSGAYYATFNVRSNSQTRFVNSKNTGYTCHKNSICQFLTTSTAQYILESVEKNNNGFYIATFTVYPN